jgi:hypothetical protein
VKRGAASLESVAIEPLVSPMPATRRSHALSAAVDCERSVDPDSARIRDHEIAQSLIRRAFNCPTVPFAVFVA